jgi:hypothetical protein
MSVFNHEDMYGGMDYKTHICVVWGASKISYLVMIGNLPVEIRTSELKLTDIHQDITSMGGDIPFYQMLKIMNSFELSARPEVGILLESSSNQIQDGKRLLTLSDSVIDIVKDRFFTFLTDMVGEIRATYDYVCSKYNTSNVYVCTNSILLDECLCKTLSDTFPVEYVSNNTKVEIYNDKFNLKMIPEFNDKYAPVLGYVIEQIKKGGDFYDA